LIPVSTDVNIYDGDDPSCDTVSPYISPSNKHLELLYQTSILNGICEDCVIYNAKIIDVNYGKYYDNLSVMVENVTDANVSYSKIIKLYTNLPLDMVLSAEDTNPYIALQYYMPTSM
jgi:hypothetical protein